MEIVEQVRIDFILAEKRVWIILGGGTALQCCDFIGGYWDGMKFIMINELFK